MGFEGGRMEKVMLGCGGFLCSSSLSPSLLVSGRSILPRWGAELVLCRGREGQG